MARPENTGIPYFPIVTEWDQKLKLVRAKYKLLGVGCIVELWKAIYAEGYALQWDEDAELLFADENSLDLETLRDIVKFAFSKGIFDLGMYEKKHVLTSHGIQKQWLSVVRAAHRKTTEIEPDLCLLAPNEFPLDKVERKPSDRSEKYGGNPAAADESIEETPQSKAKQRREEKSKELAARAPEAIAESQEQDLDLAALGDYCLKLALERKAKSPEAMARKLATQPDVVADFKASRDALNGPKRRPDTPCPPPPRCDCPEHGEIKADRVSGTGKCLSCGAWWSFGSEFGWSRELEAVATG